LLEERVDGFFVGHIDGLGEDVGPGRRESRAVVSRLGGVAGAEGQLRPLGGASLGNSLADSLIGPGDDGDFSGLTFS